MNGRVASWDGSDILFDVHARSGKDEFSCVRALPCVSLCTIPGDGVGGCQNRKISYGLTYKVTAAGLDVLGRIIVTSKSKSKGTSPKFFPRALVTMRWMTFNFQERPLDMMPVSPQRIHLVRPNHLPRRWSRT